MRNIIILAALFLPSLLIAQKNFREAVIVTSNGDTLHGYIDHKEWNYSPTEITFKTGTAGTEQKYSSSDIRYISISNIEVWQKFNTRISNSPVNVADIAARDTTTLPGEYFLKQLYKGDRIDLYSYTDRLKTRFFILSHNSNEPGELVYTKYYSKDNSSSVITEETYKQQLKNYLLANNLYSTELDRKIENTGYETRALQKLFYALDGKSPKDIQDASKSKLKRSRFFAGAGVVKGKTSFNGSHIFTTAKSSSPLSPVVAMGIDYIPNPYVGRFILRGELSGTTSSATLTAIDPSNSSIHTFEHKMTAVNLTAQLLYNVYNTATFKIPLGIGAGFSFMNHTKSTYSRQYSTTTIHSDEDRSGFEKISFLVAARAGVVYRNFETTVVFQPNVILANYINFNTVRSSYGLQLNYLFNRK